MAYRRDKRQSEDMNTHNASNSPKPQQWRNELKTKVSEPGLMPTHDMMRAPPKYLTPVLASTTVCCEQANCDQTKIEQDNIFREPAAPFMLNPECAHPQSGKRDNPAEQYMEPICSCCGLNRGQLVTICCIGRDCDNSTKIDQHMGPPDEKRAKTSYNQFKF